MLLSFSERGWNISLHLMNLGSFYFYVLSWSWQDMITITPQYPWKFEKKKGKLAIKSFFNFVYCVLCLFLGKKKTTLRIRVWGGEERVCNHNCRAWCSHARALGKRYHYELWVIPSSIALERDLGKVDCHEFIVGQPKTLWTPLTVLSELSDKHFFRRTKFNVNALSGRDNGLENGRNTTHVVKMTP